MKTILLLGITLLLTIVSCKKESKSPDKVISTTSTTTNKCTIYGACAEGWYKVVPVLNPSMDTIMCQTGTNNLGHCKLTYIKIQRNPNNPTLNKDSLIYMFTDFDFATNVLSTDTVYTNIYLYATQAPINYRGVVTKTNKYIHINFDHY